MPDPIDLTAALKQMLGDLMFELARVTAERDAARAALQARLESKP